MTTFHVRVHDGDDEDDSSLRDLARWLAMDPDARAAGMPRIVERALRPGEMGGVAETIGIVIAGVSAMGGVVSALAAWKMVARDQRKNPTVTVTTPGGRSVTIENGSPAEVAAIYDAIGD